MTFEPLTLLQKGVIARLREAGFTVLADRAYTSWRAGKPLGEEELRVEGALLDDLRTANAHAEGEK